MKTTTEQIVAALREHERRARSHFRTEQMQRATPNECDAMRRGADEIERLKAIVDDWENAAKHVESDHPDEVHCGCVPVLRKRVRELEEAIDEWSKAGTAARQQETTDVLVEIVNEIYRREGRP